MDDSSKLKNFFDALNSKSAFWVGFITAILSIGTLGFLILGSCLLKGTCSMDGFTRTETPDSVVVNTDDTTDTQQPVENVPEVTAEDHVLGDKNAKVTLIEYSDFECPFCGAFLPTVKQAMEKYKGKIKLVYRHFPLSFHPQAEPAALASECAAEQGKFWQFHDAMFENQSSLNDNFYKKLATDNKLNLNKFNDCYSSKKYLSKIQEQASSGGAAGVDGTPGTFVISADGTATPLKGAVPIASLNAAIDAALAK